MKLQGNVIIVDEAHNIEDQCREAASLHLDQANLNAAKMDCEKLSKLGVNPTTYAALVSKKTFHKAFRCAQLTRRKFVIFSPPEHSPSFCRCVCYFSRT